MTIRIWNAKTAIGIGAKMSIVYSPRDYWGDYSSTGTYPIPRLDEEVEHYPLIMQGTTTAAPVSITSGTTTTIPTVIGYSSLVLTIGLVAVVVQVSLLVIMLRLRRTQ